MDFENVQQWLDRLREAWRDRDPQASADLFTTDAVYRSHLFRPPLVGRIEIADYWASATGSQSEIEIAFGDPLLDGNRVAVEWWSMLSEGGQPTTDAGGLFLTFDRDRCADLREYWNLAEGTVPVPEGWGR